MPPLALSSTVKPSLTAAAPPAYVMMVISFGLDAGKSRPKDT